MLAPEVRRLLRGMGEAEAGAAERLARERGLSPLRAALIREAVRLGEPTQEPGPPPTTPDDDLDHDDPALTARGLDAATCRGRRIGRVRAPGAAFEGWIAVTVFDLMGDPVGRTYRRPEPTGIAPARRPRWSIPPGFPAGRHLYNLDRAWPSLLRGSAAVVVEGPFDALHLDRLGWTNAVALLGNRLTGWHVELLLTVGVREVILLLDNDHGGRLGTRWAAHDDGRLDQFRVVDLHRRLPPGRDPDELDASSLTEFLGPYRPMGP